MFSVPLEITETRGEASFNDIPIKTATPYHHTAYLTCSLTTKVSLNFLFQTVASTIRWAELHMS